jgi:Bacterial regulatory proteins, tetR family
MGKIDENKRKKKEALFNTAYELFTTKGITSTTISDIVEKAEVAKGTFYLYFTNKYDIKNKLVVHKTQELFDAAGAALEKEQIHGLEDQMIFLIDHLINHLKDDRALLNFISKNLVMGALRSALLTGENSDREIYNHFLELVAADDYEYKDVDVMLFS